MSSDVERATIRPFGQLVQIGQRELLGGLQLRAVLRQPLPNLHKEAVNQFELIAGFLRFECALDQLDAQLLQVRFFEPLEQFVFDQLRIFGAKKIETRIVQDVPLGTLEPDEASYQCLSALRHELEFSPKLIEFAPLPLVEHFLHQRPIVAEEAFDQVKPGRQAAFVIDVKESVRERAAETRGRLRQFFRHGAVAMNQQFDVRGVRVFRRFAKRRLEIDATLAALHIQLAVDKQPLAGKFLERGAG